MLDQIVIAHMLDLGSEAERIHRQRNEDSFYREFGKGPLAPLSRLLRRIHLRRPRQTKNGPAVVGRSVNNVCSQGPACQAAR
jgi:hypothetical protein